MSKPEKKPLVPALRFPEFQNSGEWKEKKLGEFISTISPPKKLLTTDYLAEGQFPVIDQSQSYICGWTNDDEAIITDGFPLIVFGDHTCILKLVDQPFAQGADGIKIFKPNKSIQTEFLYQSLQFKPLVMEQYKRHFSIFKEREVAYPDSKSGEQQKIADCLSSIDDLITTQTQKLAALKAHKKGLMQQLFPAEGETVPKLRFPEFRDGGEWEEKPLKIVFSIFQGFAFSSNDATNEGTRWLKIADVGIQYMNPNTPSYLPVSYKDEHKRFLVKLGDYVIALTRPILSHELKIAKVDAIYDNALLNQRVGKLVTDENKDFVYYLLQTSKLITDIEKNIAGNDPPNLSSQQIGDIVVRVPLKDEQKKIADCLSSADEVITAQIEKIEALKSHKKGLMQQLFPSMDEVDG